MRSWPPVSARRRAFDRARADPPGRGCAACLSGGRGGSRRDRRRDLARGIRHAHLRSRCPANRHGHDLRSRVAHEGHRHHDARDAARRTRHAGARRPGRPSWIPPGAATDREDVRLEDLLAHASGLPDTRPLYERASGNAAIERGHLRDAARVRAAHRLASTATSGSSCWASIVEDRRAPTARRAVRTTLPASADSRRGSFDSASPSAWRERTAPDPGRSVARPAVAGRGGRPERGGARRRGRAHRTVRHGRRGRGRSRGQSWAAWRAGRSFGPATAGDDRPILRRAATPGSSRALGWDTMLPTSSCGTRMSREAFGHTGFTGTSLWIDPGRAVYVVLLTNRVHPIAGPPEPIRELRRSLHDAVMEDSRWLAARGLRPVTLRLGWAIRRNATESATWSSDCPARSLPVGRTPHVASRKPNDALRLIPVPVPGLCHRVPSRGPAPCRDPDPARRAPCRGRASSACRPARGACPGAAALARATPGSR